jgi:hypothetical protein
MISSIGGGNKLAGATQQADSVAKPKPRAVSTDADSEAITKTVGELIQKLLKSLESKNTGDRSKGASERSGDMKSAIDEIMILIEEMLAKTRGDESDLSQDGVKKMPAENGAGKSNGSCGADGCGNGAPASTQAMPGESAPTAAKEPVSTQAIPAETAPTPVKDPVSTQAMPAETAAPANATANANANATANANANAAPAPAATQAAPAAAAPSAKPAATGTTADSNLTKLFDNSKGGGYTQNELKAIRQLTNTMLGATAAPAPQAPAPAPAPAAAPAASPSVNDLLSIYMDKAFTDGNLDDNELKGFEALTAKLNGGAANSTGAAGSTSDLRGIDGNISNANEAATHMFGDFLSASMMSQVYSILDKAAKTSPEDKFA